MAILSLLFIVNNAIAQTTIRYQNNIHGGATLFGNSWFYTNSAATCSPTMLTADVDDDPGTYMSSSADLILPAGSIIVKAFLAIERGQFYYNSMPLTSVKLKVPGASSYATLTPASSSFLTNRTSNFDDTYFFEQSVFDITSLMPANGFVSSASGGPAGRYFLADPGTNDYNFEMGGWSIIIVYSNPASKYRSITVADNWQIFSTGDIVNTDVTGVRVPASGTVNAVVGVTGSYGDRVDCHYSQVYTDFLRFGQTTGPLTDLADPMTGSTNNALNSSIAVTAQNNVSADGGPSMSGNVTARNPISAGHIYGPSESWDFDADIFSASGILPASATLLNIRLQQASNNGDVLVSGSYFISVDLAAPILTKQLAPSTIYDGGTAIYTFTVNNASPGSIPQSDIAFTDVLPANIRVAAVPNISISGGSGGVVTAAAGSQQISLTNLSLNAGGIATISVAVTNMPGQLNSSCGSNPAGFTNGQGNFSYINGVTTSSLAPQCLVVNPFTVSGNVFNDPNAGNVNNSTGTTNLVPAGMYVTLVSTADNKVRSSTLVNTTGSYTLPNAITGNYTVVLSTTEGVVGNAPPAAVLPAGWINTGEYNGSANGGNTAPVNGISDPFAITTFNIININFGIQRAPTAQNDYSLGNNSGASVAVNAPANDQDYNGGNIVALSVNLVAPVGATGIVVDGDGDTTVITITGEGTWTVHPTTGIITFAPQPGFTGNPTPIAYNIKDNAGAKSNNALVEVTYTTPNCSNLNFQVGWYYNTIPQTRNPYFTGIVSTATASINGAGITGTVLTATPSESLQIPTSVINGSTLASAITANDYIGMSFTTVASLQPGNSIVGTKLWVEQDDHYSVDPIPDASQMMPYQFSLQISTSPAFASDVFTIVQDQTVTYQGTRGFVDFVGNAYLLAPSTTYYLRYYLYNPQATASRIIFDDQDPIFRFCQPTISGKVYIDANGLYGTPANTVDGTLYISGGLFATLVGADNKVIASVPVSTINGMYEFNNGVPPNQTVRVLLNTTQPAIGAIVAANAVGSLPGNYVSTGENLGAGAGSDGLVNSSLTVAVGTSQIFNANFGIEQRPVANNMLWNVSGAVENNAYKVGLGELDDANGEQLLNATDPEEGQITNGTTFQIVSVPKNATGQNDPSFELRYNGTLLADGDFIENFNPDWFTLTIKTTSPPHITSFLYNVSDNAGVFSISPATYSIHLLSVLPVTGLHLKVMAVGVGRNHLEWQTLTEIGTSYSDIERSTDGNTFVSIGRVQAAENSNQRNSYIFTDDKAPEGIAYYRVRLVDKDGRNKLSNVAVITPLQWQSIKLLPNPARSFIVIAGVKEGQDIRVNGISGALVRQLSVKGISSVIDLAGFAAGTYIIQVYEKGRKVFTGKFIKQD